MRSAAILEKLQAQPLPRGVRHAQPTTTSLLRHYRAVRDGSTRRWSNQSSRDTTLSERIPCYRLKPMNVRFAVAAVLLSDLALPLGADQSVAPVASSETRNVIAAFSSAGAITLPEVQLQLDLAYPHGKRERRDLAVVYDPQNGYCLWHLAEGTAPAYTDRFHQALTYHRYYADANGLFDFASRGYLWIKVSRLRVESLDAAKRAALEEIEHGLASIERGYVPSPTGPSDPWPWDSIHVSLPISSEFICGSPARADCPSPAADKIELISREGSGWRIVLRNHWEQEVILDSALKLISTRQFAPPQ